MMGLIGCGDEIATAKYKNNILLKRCFLVSQKNKLTKYRTVYCHKLQ